MTPIKSPRTSTSNRRQLASSALNCLRLLVLVRGDLIGVKHDSEDVEDESEG
ncbi:hypothetical protein KAM344_41600 [Aeromonas caviae]|nr:hypothetical protein KAM353_44110 [Aeromonas caviae]GJB05326.1 hypothetical protein KAM360_42690 [Aeromonas caviae]GKQ68995.1 hypothetical protein KAM344_41600 [Aeromonas caviae]